MYGPTSQAGATLGSFQYFGAPYAPGTQLYDNIDGFFRALVERLERDDRVAMTDVLALTREHMVDPPLFLPLAARCLGLMAQSVPAEAAKRHGWVPGQAFAGRVILLSAPDALTVPNVALSGEGDQAFVTVLDRDQAVRREVVLGKRGPARTQVLSGLEPGERVLLASEQAAAAGEAGAAP